MTRSTLAATLLFAAVATAPAVAGAGKAPPSKAIDREMIDALDAELDRSMKSLSLPGEPPPYSIAF